MDFDRFIVLIIIWCAIYFLWSFKSKDNDRTTGAISKKNENLKRFGGEGGANNYNVVSSQDLPNHIEALERSVVQTKDQGTLWIHCDIHLKGSFLITRATMLHRFAALFLGKSVTTEKGLSFSIQFPMLDSDNDVRHRFIDAASILFNNKRLHAVEHDGRTLIITLCDIIAETFPSEKELTSLFAIADRLLAPLGSIVSNTVTPPTPPIFSLSMKLLLLVTAVIAPFAWMGGMGLSYRPVFDDIWPVLGWGGLAMVPVGAAMTIFAGRFVMGAQNALRFVAALSIVGGLVGWFAPAFTVPYLNGALDKSSPVERIVKIIGHPIGVQARPSVGAQSWRSPEETILLYVPPSKAPGPGTEWERLTLTVHSGRFGYEWYSDLRRAE